MTAELNIVKYESPKPPVDPGELYIAAMFALYIQAPARKTAPGECVDLGKIGEVAERRWSKRTPYSVAEVVPAEPERTLIVR